MTKILAYAETFEKKKFEKQRKKYFMLLVFAGNMA